jgi:hypothetical protein
MAGFSLPGASKTLRELEQAAVIPGAVMSSTGGGAACPWATWRWCSPSMALDFGWGQLGWSEAAASPLVAANSSSMVAGRHGVGGQREQADGRRRRWPWRSCVAAGLIGLDLGQEGQIWA